MKERKVSGGKALRLGRCVSDDDFSRGRNARRASGSCFSLQCVETEKYPKRKI